MHKLSCFFLFCKIKRVEALISSCFGKKQQIEASNFYEPTKKKLEEKNNLNNSISTNDLNAKSMNQKEENGNFLLNTFSKPASSYSSSSSSLVTTKALPSKIKNNNNNNVNNKQKPGYNQNWKNDEPKNTNSKQTNDFNKNLKNIAECKKFSLANYVHLLNDNEEEVPQEQENFEEEDDWIEEAAESKKSAASFNKNIERIAEKINSTARSKWKNSNIVTGTNNGSKTVAQHIRFESSSSDDSDSSDTSTSSSSSSSSSSNDSKKKVFTKRPEQKVVNKNQEKPVNNNNNNNNKKKPQQQQNNKNWKPFTKEEQVNMVSYNRSFVIQVISLKILFFLLFSFRFCIRFLI